MYIWLILTLLFILLLHVQFSAAEVTEPWNQYSRLPVTELDRFVRCRPSRSGCGGGDGGGDGGLPAVEGGSDARQVDLERLIESC